MQLGEKLNHLDTLSVEMIHTSSLRLNVGLVLRLPHLLFHRPPHPLPFSSSALTSREHTGPIHPRADRRVDAHARALPTAPKGPLQDGDAAHRFATIAAPRHGLRSGDSFGRPVPVRFAC